MTEFLSGIEHIEPQRIEQAKSLLRAVTYCTQDMAFDHLEDKPDRKMVVCEMWTPDGSGGEWMRWLSIDYTRLDMPDFWTAVLLTAKHAENLRDGVYTGAGAPGRKEDAP